jgi:hypothetical protein
LDKQALLDAGVPLPDSSSMRDSASIEEEFRPFITEALTLLRSWIREPSEGERVFSKMFGGNGGWGAPRASVLESKYPMSEILNTPFFVEKVTAEKGVCPECLVKLGLAAVFACMEVSEDRLGISHEGAVGIVEFLDRMEPYTDWEGWDDGQTYGDEEEGIQAEETAKGTPGQQMRAVFAACAANPESSIVA